MDIVIPLGRGSVHDNLELRWCLRGIEKYVCDVENVFIVGEKPSFLQNIIHVSALDVPEKDQKEANIFRKIMVACGDKRVSDDFLFFNDDHFLLKPFEPLTYHYKCSLQESIDTRRVKDIYFRTLNNTLSVLGGGNNFDTHCPILYNKTLFKKSVGTLRWHIKGGYCIKTVYCQMNGITGEWFQDLKIGKPFTTSELRTLIANRPYFSVADHGITPAFKKLMEYLYPEKSRYES